MARAPIVWKTSSVLVGAAISAPDLLASLPRGLSQIPSCLRVPLFITLSLGELQGVDIRMTIGAQNRTCSSPSMIGKNPAWGGDMEVWISSQMW